MYKDGSKAGDSRGGKKRRKHEEKLNGGGKETLQKGKKKKSLFRPFSWGGGHKKFRKGSGNSARVLLKKRTLGGLRRNPNTAEHRAFAPKT